MTYHLSGPEAKYQLQRAVEAHGSDFVYPDEWRNNSGRDLNIGMCQYVHEGQPACIVGQVFAQLGHDVTKLDDCFSEPRTAGRRLGIEMDDEAAMVLWTAQDKQDEGETWGNAVLDAIAAPHSNLLAERHWAAGSPVLTSEWHGANNLAGYEQRQYGVGAQVKVGHVLQSGTEWIAYFDGRALSAGVSTIEWAKYIVDERARAWGATC